MLGVVFFFKQKTAYEMLRSLVGSEMCIRDRGGGVCAGDVLADLHQHAAGGEGAVRAVRELHSGACLLYTSDAADDLLCVDLGGRRIMTKKTKKIMKP